MKLIVEMEMPKNCPCELSAEVFDPSGNYGGHQPCFAWYGIPARSKEFDRCVVRSERPAWCPIVCELPEQHGDLIDRDALLKHVYKMKAPIGAEVTVVDACYITHAESVIAAEKTEEQRKEPE